MRASIALLISGLAAQQVAAHWDRQASNYNTPGYNNNECTEKQKGGYNWSDLNDGDKPGKYDDFNFGGDWKCSTKKFGKRDHISKRHFGEKAITNKCGKEKPASFSCDQKKEGFSVTHIDVSVDHDADLDFHYKMKDGSICKQRTSCKKEGTTVQNTQCGGAESVDVYLGHSSEGRDDCEIGVHQIGFDCNPGESYTPPPPYTPAPPPSTSEVPVTSSEIPSTSEVPVTSSEVPPPSTPTPPPQTSDSPPPPPESSSESIKTPDCSYGGCGSTGYSNSTAPPTPPETPATSAPAESTPVETPATSAPAESTPSGECGGYGQPACETKPVESVPAETPATSAPVESTPVESTPAETPATSAPVESTPVESTPAETPATSAPVESTPVESTPAETPATSAPVESTPVESTPAETPATSAPAQSTPSGECGGYGQPACETSAPVESVPAETPATSAPVESTPAETPATSAPVESTPVESTPAETPATSAPAQSTPSGECGGYGQPACETKPVESVPAETPVTSSPAQSTEVSPSSPVESPSTPAESQPPTVTPPPGGYTPPECLPKCLNTWLKLKTECKDNTDSACYCKVPDLTDNVIDCVKAYGTEEEVKQALSYFVGICAPQIPENPQIIDKCSDVPLSPPQPTPTPESPITPPPESPATSASPDAPVTSAPAPEIPADIPCTTISYGGSSYVVPQVGFTTEAPGAPGANPTEPIALYPAAPTPAPAPAEPTAPYPVPSGFTSVPLPTGTGAIGAPPAEFEGAAFSLKGSSKGVGMVAGAVLAFFAL